MSDITRILSQIESGDPLAAEQLLPLVYEELRKLAAVRLAQEKPGQTLQAAALEKTSDLRSGFLAEVCGSNRTLHDRIVGYLKARSSDDIMSTFGRSSQVSQAPAIPTWITPVVPGPSIDPSESDAFETADKHIDELNGLLANDIWR